MNPSTLRCVTCYGLTTNVFLAAEDLYTNITYHIVVAFNKPIEMRAVRALALLGYLFNQVDASGGGGVSVCRGMGATAMAYGAMATGGLRVSNGHGAGEKETQQAMLDNKNQEPSTNGTLAKQQECPEEPLLCSNEECGGHVRLLQEGFRFSFPSRTVADRRDS